MFIEKVSKMKNDYKMNEYKMLQIGHQYFPLMDVGKKFFIQDTVSYEIDIPKKLQTLFDAKIDNSLYHNLLYLEILYDHIEREVWKQIMKDNYNNVSWVRIDHISPSIYENKLTVNIDLLEATK
jgi:hypothetical protein